MFRRGEGVSSRSRLDGRRQGRSRTRSTQPTPMGSNKHVNISVHVTTQQLCSNDKRRKRRLGEAVTCSQPYDLKWQRWLCSGNSASGPERCSTTLHQTWCGRRGPATATTLRSPRSHTTPREVIVLSTKGLEHVPHPLTWGLAVGLAWPWKVSRCDRTRDVQSTPGTGLLLLGTCH